MGKLFKNKIVLIAIAVLVMAGIGFGGFMLGRGGKDVKPKTTSDEITADAGAEAEPEPEAEKKEGGHGGHGGAKEEEGENAAAPSKKELTFTFQDLTVNLLDPKASTFLRTSIQIEAKNAQAFKLIEDNVHPLRDATVFLLSGKTREEVATPESWERIKRELLARYEGKLGPKVVSEIYVTDHNIIMN